MVMWDGLLGEKKKLDELYHKELSTVMDLQRVTFCSAISSQTWSPTSE